VGRGDDGRRVQGEGSSSGGGNLEEQMFLIRQGGVLVHLQDSKYRGD